MGAWGEGPFDSDAALDSLAFLAEELGVSYDADHELVIAGLDPNRAERQLRELLATAASSMPEGAYAAAGLVAARLAKVPTSSGGTRLWARLETGGAPADGLGLASHCGYLTLLDTATAERLRDAARAAVTALAENTTWLSDWSNRARIGAMLEMLGQELAAA